MNININTFVNVFFLKVIFFDFSIAYEKLNKAKEKWIPSINSRKYGFKWL